MLNKFRYTYDLESVALEESIKKSGILTPIIFKEDKIVSGFRRFHVAKKLGIENIPIYQTTKNDLDVFLESILENAAIREFNDLEKATITTKLLHDFKADDLIFQNIWKILKIGVSEYNLQKYLQVAALDENLKKSLYLKKMKPETAIILQKLPKREQILNLKMNANLAAEIVENLKDIYQKDGIFPEEIFKFESIEEVRKFLKMKRFPVLTEKEVEFEKVAKLLQKNMTLTHFPYFEKEECEITIKFKNLEEVEKWRRGLEE